MAFFWQNPSGSIRGNPRAANPHASENPFRGSGQRSTGVVNIEQLASMLGLPEFEGSYNEDYVWEARSYAEKEARSGGASEEDAEQAGYKAEETVQNEVYGQWHNAVESTAEKLLDEHGLKLVPKKPSKGAKRPYEYTISPETSWNDAASKIRETINGVGYFHFDSTKEFLDSGPWTAREGVLEHLHWIKRWPDVYGEGSARGMYERAWR